MSGIVTKVRKGVLAASLLGALGFGAAMALASPVEAKAQPTCNPHACNTMCEARHGPFASGFCDPDLGCICAI